MRTGSIKVITCPVHIESRISATVSDQPEFFTIIRTLFHAFTEVEDEDDIDTLGGLIFSLAGRVPARGELIAHPSGIEFEVLDADRRRVKKLRVHLPQAIPPGGGSAA